MNLYDYVMIFLMGAGVVLFALAITAGLIKLVTIIFSRKGDE